MSDIGELACNSLIDFQELFIGKSGEKSHWEKLGRTFVKPRKVLENNEEDFYATRKLKPI